MSNIKRLSLIYFLTMSQMACAYQITLNPVMGEIPPGDNFLPPSAKIMVGPKPGSLMEARTFTLKRLPANYSPMYQSGYVWGGVLYHRPTCSADGIYVLTCKNAAPFNHDYRVDITVLKAPDSLNCANGIIDCQYRSKLN